MKKKKVYLFVGILILTLAPTVIFGATNKDNEFKELFEYIYSLATGYFARGVAISGGIIGLLLGAIAGKPLTAFVGILFGFAGAWGPKIINSFFSSATI